ncbi:DUF6088 family protein [Brevundimonas sp.]|uniref:DUF6088 family protein n=1 Tax=Brevundimonas sp. TaxID=1871086 RepID=UPI0028A1CB5B|nr:DUF6088 family protein [Brevundimonas sp.]
MSSLADKIQKRVRAKGRGSVFVPADFLDLGSRANVDQTLSRLVDRNQLRKLARGLYDYPRVSARLGVLAPTPDKVAKALAADAALQTPGAITANQLGLTTQIVAKPIYLTDGPSRSAKIGRQTVTLKHVNRLPAAGKPAGDVYQALRWLGRDGVTADVVRQLRSQLTSSAKRDLSRIAKQAPAWMRAPLHDVAA